MKKIVITAFLITGVLLSMFTDSSELVAAPEDNTFEGWNKDTKNNVWEVYANTDWQAFKEYMIIGPSETVPSETEKIPEETSVDS